MSIEDAYIELRKTNQLRQETITKLSKENKKLKEKLEKIEKVITKCININDNLESCKDCEYDKECKAGVEHFVLKIIEGAEDE